MAFSPAPPQPRRRDRAHSSSPRRHLPRWIILVLLLATAGFAFATPALAATQAPTATHATTTHATTATSPVKLTAEVTPNLPGGVCQVPGIGDIGGLVHLCQSGSSGIVGDLNNICEPSLPQPEQATGGIDAMIEPPAASSGGLTLYDSYGIAGQFWAAHGLQCSDMTSLIGNNVAGMVFDAAKSFDRVTITVYQSAAGNNILTWLQDAVDGLISALGNAIYFPYLAPVVILGAIWLAWQGLIRKRATRTIEGTLWMVVACAAAIALIGLAAAFTGVGTTVSNGVTSVLNEAFSKLPAPASSNCLPVQQGDPQSVTGNYAFTSGNSLVDNNANELWSVLVCKPWLDGELGTTEYATTASGQQTVVNTYGRQLLWSQAIASNETPSNALIQAKQATYSGIASDIQQNNPAIYPLFQGNQWTSRLEIAFAAVFAAFVAGLLILLISLTLIVLKLGFLLLLVAGPFFLIVGTHPGFGRVIAIRWFEMLVGVLMKQAAIAVVLSVLLYSYSLIMGTADSVLPWALKILMIALVTVAVFIYRRPFTHLFSAVGYGTIGSAERADYSLREAGATFRRSTLDAATVAIPGVAGYRAARWARRNPGQAAAVAAGVASGAAAGAAVGAAAGTGADTTATGDGYPSRLRPDAPPPIETEGEASAGSRRVAGVSGAGSARARNLADAGASTGRIPPPLDLPPRAGGGLSTSGSAAAGGSNGSAGSSGSASGGSASGSRASGGIASGASASGWSRGAGRSAAPGTRTRPAASGSAPASGPVRSAGPSASPGGTRSPRSSGFFGSSGLPGTGRAPRRTGSAPAINRGGSGPAGGSSSGSGNGSGSSGGSASTTRSSGGSGPAWPSSGWSSASVRQRSSGRPAASPSAPASEGGQGSQDSQGGSGSQGRSPDEAPARPFWLRPMRRDK